MIRFAAVLVCLAATSAFAQDDADVFVVVRKSVDGVSLGARAGSLAGFVPDGPERLRRGPLAVMLKNGAVTSITRALSPLNPVHVVDGARTVNVEPGALLSDVAETLGTCGPVRVFEGGSSIPCRGLELGSGDHGLTVRLDLEAAVPSTTCTRYFESRALAAGWTFKAGDRVCWGDTVFTTDTTLEEGQRAIPMASEVVADPLGERVRSRQVHLVFAKKKLVRLEHPPAPQGARVPAPPVAPARQCAEGRLEDCRRECVGGDLESCAVAGALLSPDPSALAYSKQACDGGNAKGCFNLGLSYEKGLGTRVDLPLARATHARGCSLGSGTSCGNLGHLQLKGIGGPVDGAGAAQSFETGCRLGGGLACVALGGLYAEGRFVEKSRARAEASFLRGCDVGAGGGCDSLGERLASGEGFPKDEPRAFELFERACANGDASGCSNAGAFLQSGKRSVPRQAAVAKARFEKACGLGDASGCTWVGIMTVAGDGVPKDLALGRDFLRKGCRMGDEQGCKLAELPAP